jgi:hypothetical protein
MATSKNAKLQFESGQSFVDYTVMTDSGDHQIYSLGTIWSMKSGYEASVRPNGMVTGRNVLSTHTTEETVTVAAFTAYSAGTLFEVTATTALAVRPGTDVAKIDSVTMDNAGAIALVEGTPAANAVFITTRGGAGGPPYIPADSVEVGQIRMNTTATAVLTAAEIFQTVGTHTERFDYPIWEENPIGDGDQADTTAEKNSHIKFAEALDPIHTGDAYKLAYVSYYAPVFATVSKSLDFTKAGNTHSVSSTQFYDGVSGATSASLGQGGFTALLTDGVTDSLVANVDAILTFKFFPDKNKTPYVLSQGTLGLVNTWPVDNQNQAVATISAENASVNFSS